MMPNRKSYDCIVLGAGPAGSTAAALMAKAGVSTLLVERETLPRERVGESLMPETYWTFEKLGLLEKLQASRYPKKVGVQFVSHAGRESQPFFFRSRRDHASSETWHVDRAEFDKLLFDTAAEFGAERLERTRVLEVLFDGDCATGVRLQTASGERIDLASRVVLDATGQQTLIANQLGLKRPDPDFRKAAIWRHYSGGERDTSGGGVKTIILHSSDQRSWFWYIPQSHDQVSVGVVGDTADLLKGRGSIEQIFEEELAKCEGVARRLRRAEPVDDLSVMKEFAYSTTQSAGPGWAMIGDAWGFIDPVYSSGVYFALKSADMATECAIRALHANDLSAERLGVWQSEFTAGTKWVRQLVHAFYCKDFRIGQFIQAHPQHAGPLTDLLVGKMFSPDMPALFADLNPWLEEEGRKN